MAKDHVLPQAGFLDGFTQFDVVNNFQTQRLIGADGLVSGAADKVKRADADVIDRVLSLFEMSHYRFVTLSAAQKDPAYQIPDTVVTPRRSQRG